MAEPKTPAPDESSLKEFWTTPCPCGALLHYPERKRGATVICGRCDNLVKTPGPPPEELRYRDLNEKLDRVIDTIKNAEQKLLELDRLIRSMNRWPEL